MRNVEQGMLGRKWLTHFGLNKHLTVWSSQWGQPLNGSSEPSQNDCGNTGKACWEHWCLFSSQPLSSHDLVVIIVSSPASLEQPGHLGWLLISSGSRSPFSCCLWLTVTDLNVNGLFFDWWHRQYVSRLKLDGIQELDNAPQTTATELKIKKSIVQVLPWGPSCKWKISYFYLQNKTLERKLDENSAQNI